MAEKKPADTREPTPLEPGDPVPADAVTQQGSTFAERAKAAAKRVRSGDSEDKAVSSASTKKAKKSAKKG